MVEKSRWQRIFVVTQGDHQDHDNEDDDVECDDGDDEDDNSNSDDEMKAMTMMACIVLIWRKKVEENIL